MATKKPFSPWVKVSVLASIGPSDFEGLLPLQLLSLLRISFWRWEVGTLVPCLAVSQL